MTVPEYVVEEVTRQGHVEGLDHIERVGWMLNAWCYALEFNFRKPEIEDAVHVGQLIERGKNHSGIRTCGVRVGYQVCPPPEDVLRLLAMLWEQRDVLSPLEFYKSFEQVHPFIDGNGRTGKILLNWLNGSLLNPIFPPSNLWGREIRNP